MILEISTEKCTNYVFCISLCFTLIMFTFNTTARLLVGNTYYLDTIFVSVIYYGMVIIALPNIIRHIRIGNLAFIILFLVLPIIMCKDSEVLSTLTNSFLPSGLVAFAVGLSIEDYDEVWRILKKVAWMVVILCFYDVFILNALEDVTVSHTLAYWALVPACVFAIKIISEFQIIDILGLAISLILIVQSSTAGALASFVICVMVSILYLVKNLDKGKKTFVFILTVIILLIVNNLNTLLTGLAVQLQKLNINVTVLNEIAGNDVTNDIYRESIYEYCLAYAKEHIFWGCGIGNDRVLITQNTLVKDQSLVGNYPHNIFLEFMVQFGFIVGIIIGIILVVLLLKHIFKETETSAKKILLFLLGVGIYPLLFSGSYLESSTFLLLLGFCIGRLRRIKEDLMFYIEDA